MTNETRTITLSEVAWLRLETLALGLGPEGETPDIAALLERIAGANVNIRIEPGTEQRRERWTFTPQDPPAPDPRSSH